MGGVLVRANETSCWQAKSRPLTKNGKSSFSKSQFQKNCSKYHTQMVLSQKSRSMKFILVPNSRCFSNEMPPYDWTKSRFFYLHIQEISVFKKTLSGVCCMKPIYNMHMLISPCSQNCIKFCRRIAWQRFLVNNFADFTHVIKEQEFFQSFMAFGIIIIIIY